jgi:multiple sugar transport system substrate-binding protein
MITLKGTTWDHSRGHLPMVATSQRFHELHPDVEIIWQKRSLQAFADHPIEKLAEDFDLLVIDHPFVGYAAAQGTFLPLDGNPKFLQDQAQHSVGRSHESYFFDDHQWAFAIDAATPVSCWRPDLLDTHKLSLPDTWDDLMDLASDGWVTLPGIPIDSLMNFYMLCQALGAELFQLPDQVVGHETGGQALQLLRNLVQQSKADCFKRNPIAVYEAMTLTDEIAYCPFAYGYSNYARQGYARRVLKFGDLITFGRTGYLRTTLGGTGLAISAGTKYPEVAIEYVHFVADPECQRTLYAQSGGQPGHRSAWQDTELNRLTGDFFKRTLPALDRAYVRPRYNGYLGFQNHAGSIVYQFLQNGGDPTKTLEQIDRAYERSKKDKP